MEKSGTAIVSILTAVIGLSILAVLLSTKSNTVAVLGAAASGFGGILATAMSPITGATSGGFGGFSGGSSSPLSMLGGGSGSSPLSMLSSFGGGGGMGGMDIGSLASIGMAFA